MLSDAKKRELYEKEESRQLKKVEQVAVWALPWTSLICFLEEEAGCKEKGEVKMLCINSQ